MIEVESVRERLLGSVEDRRDQRKIAVILPGAAEDRWDQLKIAASPSSCRGRRRAAGSMTRTHRSTKGRSTRRNSRWRDPSSDTGTHASSQSQTQTGEATLNCKFYIRNSGTPSYMIFIGQI